MANYYAFTKNGKPVLGSPIQGKKPRRGKSTPIYLGQDCKVLVQLSFPDEAQSFTTVDSYRLNCGVNNGLSENDVPLRLGYVYTGSFLTKESFLQSLNLKFGSIFQFTFIGEELFITRSFAGTVTNPFINLIHD